MPQRDSDSNGSSRHAWGRPFTFGSGDAFDMPAMTWQCRNYDMKGEGVPLVFIHQASMDHRLWDHQRFD
jgi:hypothetical protein